jgi:hypothetical protein
MTFHTKISGTDAAGERMRIHTDGNIGMGDNAPGTLLQMKGTAPYITLQNSTAENSEGGCEGRILFEDHGNNPLAQVEGSHTGTADDEKGQLTFSTNNDSGLQAGMTINDTQQVIIGAGKLVLGSTAVTSSAAELNYADGVTSAIQTQLDGKSPVAGHSSIVTTGTIGTGVWQGTAVASAYLDADTAHLSGTQTFSGAKTFSADVVISGTTPQLTIGDAGAEDTLLVFDGNAQDYRIGIDDGTDTLEIGVGAAHGTTPAIVVAPDAGVKVMGTLEINASIADEAASGVISIFTAGEALVRGEVVYFKAGDSKMWKAVATAAATSRCVAMAAEDLAADAVGKFLLQGFLRDNGSFPAYTIAGALYTPEAETSSQNVPEQAAPATDGDFVQVLGWAVTADMVYFNPSNDIIEVA